MIATLPAACQASGGYPRWRGAVGLGASLLPVSSGERTPVRIRHFTDPGCPFAFSAERQRLRLEWLYADQLEWSTHMVVLREES